MNLLSKQDHKATSIPGVSFRTRLIGPSLRARVNLELSETRRKLNDLEHPIEALGKQLNELLDVSEKGPDGFPMAASDVSKATSEMLALADKLRLARENRTAIERAQLAPVYFRAGLISIDGLTMDGGAVTGDLLCEYGPDALFEEVLAAVVAQFYFSGIETKNSSSPTTSDKPGDGTATEAESGTANVVKPPEITSSATAGGISLVLHAVA